MKIDDSIFAVKLYEMEEQYGKLQCRIRACEQGGREKIRSALKRAEDEYKENTMLLEEKVRSCRSPAVKSLSTAQLDYRKRTEGLMGSELSRDVHSEASSPGGGPAGGRASVRRVCHGFCHTLRTAGADRGAERP